MINSIIMRKFTTISLAALASASMVSALDFSDFKAQPIVKNDPNRVTLGGLLGGSLGSGSTGEEADCFGEHADRASGSCGTLCKPDEWGCDGHFLGVADKHRPSARNVLGATNELNAFIIPAQVLLQNTTTDVESNFHSHSSGNRTKTQADKFCVKGNFCRNEYECENGFQNAKDCFYENGCLTNNWDDHEGDHNVDCDCNGISSTDLMDFGPTDCDCQAGDTIETLVEDPVVDITKRINKEIYKTIGDVLSQILSTSITESLTHCVTID